MLFVYSAQVNMYDIYAVVRYCIYFFDTDVDQM